MASWIGLDLDRRPAVGGATGWEQRIPGSELEEQGAQAGSRGLAELGGGRAWSFRRLRGALGEAGGLGELGSRQSGWGAGDLQGRQWRATAARPERQGLRTRA